MSARILGIDPGLSGALALLTTDMRLEIFDMPTLEIERGGKSRRAVDTHALAKLVRQLVPTVALVETVGPRPGQGVASMFQFGRVVGQIEGTLSALEIPVVQITAPVWRRYFSVPEGKDGSRLSASSWMPAYAERWHRKGDHGRAEASLIALYGALQTKTRLIAESNLNTGMGA